MEKTLQVQLKDTSALNVKECIGILMTAVRADGKGVAQDVRDVFFEKVEASLLVSTILKDDGAHVRAGIDAAAAPFSCMEANVEAQRNMDENGTDGESQKKLERTLEFLKSHAKLMQGEVDCCTALTGLNAMVSVPVLTPEDMDQVTAIMQILATIRESAFQMIVETCQKMLDGSFIADDAVTIDDEILKIEAHSDIVEEVVRSKFDVKFTRELSSKATGLEQALAHVNTTASAMGMNAEDIVNDIAKYQTSYGNTIRWMATGNVLYSLLSKAVRRAVQTSG